MPKTGNTPAAAFDWAMADKDGPPIYMEMVPNSSLMVMGRKDAKGNIVPMLYQSTGFCSQVENYDDEHGVVRWRMPQ